MEYAIIMMRCGVILPDKQRALWDFQCSKETDQTQNGNQDDYLSQVSVCEMRICGLVHCDKQHSCRYKMAVKTPDRDLPVAQPLVSVQPSYPATLRWDEGKQAASWQQNETAGVFFVFK